MLRPAPKVSRRGTLLPPPHLVYIQPRRSSSTYTKMAPSNMQAARFHAAKDLRVEQVELPPVAAGEVRVKVAFAGICGR